MCLVVVLIASSQEAAVPYFRRVREVKVSVSDKQNYVVVDEEIWRNCRPDLADVRLLSGDVFYPFALREETAASIRDEKVAKLLNLGSRDGRSVFDLDLGSASEYDHVRLDVTAKNFVVTATVEGMNDLASLGRRTKVRNSTLYDFSRENLGSNLTIQLPTSTFRFLHVTLNPPLRPQDVQGATVFDVQERSTAWTKLGECKAEGEKNRSTVYKCEVQESVPVDRIAFELPESEQNFRREVAVYNAQNSRVGSGEITRVRMNRNGTNVSTQSLAIDLAGRSTGNLSVQVLNNDDQPLRITRVVALSVERRIYFDPQGATAMKLYYGDPKAPAPVFDYAKLFREEPSAAEAWLGSGNSNPLYTPRPDDRPWSERHKSLLWAVMIVAVAVLSAVALRGLRTGPPAKSP
jgi:hypothetical protein